MDTLTHALSGALIARATAPARLRPEDPPIWQRVTLCAVAAAFPDSDAIISLFSSYQYLLHHRGETHSLLLFPLWALLLAAIAALCFKRRDAWRTYAGVAALGIVVHILGDLITSFGTLIFAPFSDRRVAWGTTFIIDLWFSGIIIAGLVASWVWKHLRLPAVIASLALVSYVGLQAVWRHQAIEFGERYARQIGIQGARVSVQPGAVLPLNWMVVIEKDGNYRYTYVNLRREKILEDPGPTGGFIAGLNAGYLPLSYAIWRKASLLGVDREDAMLAREVWIHPEFQFFRWFAQYPVLLRVESGVAQYSGLLRVDNKAMNPAPEECVWFQDLRFHRPGTSFNPFRFGMCRAPGGPWQRFRLNGESDRERFG